MKKYWLGIFLAGFITLAHGQEERVLVGGSREAPTVVARVKGAEITLQFSRSQMEMSGSADGDGVFRIQGKRWRYEVIPMGDGNYQLVEFALPKDAKTWAIVLSAADGEVSVAPVVKAPVLRGKWSGAGNNGQRVTAHLDEQGMHLTFISSGRQLTSQGGSQDGYLFKGKIFNYKARRQGEGWLLMEHRPQGQPTGWQAELRPAGAEKKVEPPVVAPVPPAGAEEKVEPPVVAPVPPSSAPVGEELQGKGGKSGVVLARFTDQGVVLRFAPAGQEHLAPADGKGGYFLQGKKFHYAIRQREGGWQLTEYYPDGRPSGWQTDLLAKEATPPPPVVAPVEVVQPSSPPLLSQVTGKEAAKDKVLVGLASNGTRVVLQQEEGGMVLLFPALGSKLKGEMLADGGFRFHGKRYVYITTPHPAGGQLVREFYLDGEKKTGWSAHLTEKAELPKLFPTASFGKRTAFTTNSYFSDKLINVDGFLQPNAVINVLPSGRQGELGFMVLDLVLVKGVHHLNVIIRGEGDSHPGDMRFEPVNADMDGYIYTAVGVVEGPLLAGWLTFRVMDRLEGREANEVGIFRILAKELPEGDGSGLFSGGQK